MLWSKGAHSIVTFDNVEMAKLCNFREQEVINLYAVQSNAFERKLEGGFLVERRAKLLETFRIILKHYSDYSCNKKTGLL